MEKQKKDLKIKEKKNGIITENEKKTKGLDGKNCGNR